MEVQNYTNENFTDYSNANGAYNNYTEEGEYEEPCVPGEDYIEAEATQEEQGQSSPSSREKERDRER